MSPELLDPGRFGITDYRPTKRSDCYALGMLVYEVHADVTIPIHGSDLSASGSLWKSSILGDPERRSSDNRCHGW